VSRCPAAAGGLLATIQAHHPPPPIGETVLNRFARALFTRILTPIAAFLVRRGVSPDVVTLIGTLGVVFGALAFYPRGSFFWGTVVITCFVFSDLIDGTMARMSGRSSSWGAWLDSTLDRIGDAAVFGGIALWFAGDGDDLLMVSLALYCLAAGAVVSYARARAEGLGMTANVGVTERADRLVAILVSTGLDGLGVPYVQAAALWLLAIGSTVTIGQRALAVRRQALAETP
jgi:CDP-diacylglycerol--glycerol-3-phosphate 3-phosphatidyltransferase